MKRIIYSTILVMSLSLLILGLVAGTANPGLATSDKFGELEIAVCQFGANSYATAQTQLLYLYLDVYGTGSINPSGQGIKVANSIAGVADGSEEAACAAFRKLAESLGCTTSATMPWESGIMLNCVCQGPYDRLIPVIGALMKFPLTWTPPK
jgi:hypothetical protein